MSPIIKYDGQNPPDDSTLVTALTVGPGEQATDPIAIRGYLGHSDILDRVISFMTDYREALAPDQPRKDLLDKVLEIVNNAQVKSEIRKIASWRLYLSPNLDRYVEFRWQEHVVAWRQETQQDRLDAYTIWLRTRTDRGVPIQYLVTQTSLLAQPANSYLGGDLIDDYMGQPASQSLAWDGQYGPFTGKGSGVPCSGV